MDIWDLYDSNGNWVNSVRGTEKNIKSLCEEEGYTYLYSYTENDDDRTITEGPVIDYLNAQIHVVDNRVDFIEDCIAEMAMEVYKEE